MCRSVIRRGNAVFASGENGRRGYPHETAAEQITARHQRSLVFDHKRWDDWLVSMIRIAYWSLVAARANRRSR